jgi:hypothetical protein
MQENDPSQIQNALACTSDEMNRTIMGVETPLNIYSDPETAIIQALRIVFWEKPKDVGRLEREILTDLTTQFTSEQIDIERFANGIYFLIVLLQKYENGNGRTARAMRLLVEKACTNGSIGDNDIKQVLGIDWKIATQTGEGSFQINFNPNLERLILGVAYFAINKGLSQDEVVGTLKLNGVLPEQGLDVLSKRLRVGKTQLKDEFVHFMTVESDLSWCDFET